MSSLSVLVANGFVVVSATGAAGRVVITKSMTIEEVDNFIRALAAARVELSKESPR